MAEEETEELFIGANVWAEWTENIFYKGIVTKINENAIEVLFNDGDTERYKMDEIDMSVVMDVKIGIDSDSEKVKAGDNILVKFRCSEAMRKGIVIDIGKIFYSVQLNDTKEVVRRRRRSSNLRLFGKFKLHNRDSRPVKEEPLHESVEIVAVIDGNEGQKKNPAGSNLHLFSPLIPLAHQPVLPKVLSPEILWGKQNLIDFKSPTECENTTSAHKLGDIPNQTVGLSMDPLRAGSAAAANFTQCSLFSRPRGTAVSPIDASTPVSGPTTRSSVSTTLEVSSLDF